MTDKKASAGGDAMSTNIPVLPFGLRKMLSGNALHHRMATPVTSSFYCTQIHTGALYKSKKKENSQMAHLSLLQREMAMK